MADRVAFEAFYREHLTRLVRACSLITLDAAIGEEVAAEAPFEILAVATYPLRPGGEGVADGLVLGNAVEDLGSNDILIWVSENGNACGGTRTSGGTAGFYGRPDEFGPLNLCDDTDRLCPTDGRDMIPGIRGWWMGFADAGRGFYVFVGMGEQASADPARAQLAWDVLDSLRFLPR